MTMPTIRLVLCAIALCSGCALWDPFAESGLHVRGRVEGVRSSSQFPCVMKLLTEAGDRVHEVPTTVHFNMNFLRSPASNSYVVEIRCEGEIGSFRSAPHRATGAQSTFDLGVVHLTGGL
jgi:hypothetical protein